MEEGLHSNIRRVSDAVEVLPTEIIGRRLQKAHLLSNESNVKYRWDTFFDSRVDTDLSVDHIGDIGNAKVAKKLIPEVSAIAQKDFDSEGKGLLIGWAGVRRKTLNRFRVIRTPVLPEERPENPNPHHCEILRPNHRNIEAARSLSYELTYLAESENNFVSSKF